ncbi:MAG: hypothetical protein KIS78_26630 [Labilithrix sp.]|nr:hypothetical protein [Labilithrix sp.]
MIAGQDEPARPGAVARVLGSLANALLDLGLPAIREWLRDRLGPAADVAEISTDGARVLLSGVVVPIGARGRLVLEHASATITALGIDGLPSIRLHAFEGVVAFGDAAPGFRAAVSFTAAAEPDEAAWIWGELAIEDATWTAREGSPAVSPMSGRARLFVSSREWRLDGGRLDGEVFRGRFVGGGSLEAPAAPEPEAAAPLVPPALSTIALSLERGRVGPFVDAVSGLAGRGLEVPSFVPLDAELDGELSWSLPGGGRAELRVASEAIRATLRGAIGPSGEALDGRVDAYVRPAALLRRSRVPRAALPRDEDVVQIELDVGGDLRRPAVVARLRAPEIGARLGRPRFVPAVVLRDLEGEAFVKDDRAVLRASARARSTRVTVDVDADVRAPSSARGTLRAHALDAAFLRDVARTLGARLTIPDDVVGAVDFTLAPGEAGPSVTGAATASSASSRLALDVSREGARITGLVAARDVLATGVFARAPVAPADGELALALGVVRRGEALTLVGTAAAARIALAVRARPDLAPYVLEDATADVALGPDALEYDELRFRAHGGRFVARGRVPFASDPASVPLDLTLEEGGAELAAALLALTRRTVAPPRELSGRGRLSLDGGRSLRADVNVETPAGTALALALTRPRGGGLAGSTVAGDVALADVVASGALAGGDEAHGIVRVDALVVAAGEGSAVLAALAAERVVVTYADLALVASGVDAAIRIDAAGLMWSRLAAQLYGGAIASSGVWSRGGALHARVSFSQVAVHALPPVGGHEPARFVRGRLSGSILGRRDERLRVAGDVVLEDAAFPALDLVQPALARYGLRPPNEDAAGPVTATVSGTDWGVSLRDVKVELRGASVVAELGISRERTLDGRAEVILDEAYLRTSKILTLPRVLSDRLVLPIRVEGPLERPRVRAGLGESLGRFLKDNRVTAFVSSAVEEAQILLGRPTIAEPERVEGRPPHAAELDAELRATLSAHAADWQTLDRRAAERADRYRVG